MAKKERERDEVEAVLRERGIICGEEGELDPEHDLAGIVDAVCSFVEDEQEAKLEAQQRVDFLEEWKLRSEVLLETCALQFESVVNSLEPVYGRSDTTDLARNLSADIRSHLRRPS